MTGWRARLGFLVPPGNPTVETEMIALAPHGVTVNAVYLARSRVLARLREEFSGLDQ